MTKDEIKACILLKQQEMPFDVKKREAVAKPSLMAVWNV